MDVKTALQLIDQNIANLSGTRQAHEELQQAMTVIENFINAALENMKNSKPKKSTKA